MLCLQHKILDTVHFINTYVYEVTVTSLIIQPLAAAPTIATAAGREVGRGPNGPLINNDNIYDKQPLNSQEI